MNTTLDFSHALSFPISFSDLGRLGSSALPLSVPPSPRPSPASGARGPAPILATAIFARPHLPAPSPPAKALQRWSSTPSAPAPPSSPSSLSSSSRPAPTSAQPSPPEASFPSPTSTSAEPAPATLRAPPRASSSIARPSPNTPSPFSSAPAGPVSSSSLVRPRLLQQQQQQRHLGLHPDGASESESEEELLPLSPPPTGDHRRRASPSSSSAASSSSMQRLRSAMAGFGIGDSDLDPDQERKININTNKGGFNGNTNGFGHHHDDGDEEGQDDSDPLLKEEDDVVPTSCRAQTARWILDFSNVFKAFIGSNFLGMPYAFSQSGVYGGIIGIMIIALVTDHCCKLLVHCKNHLPDAKDVKTYGDVGVRLMGRPGKILVDIFLVFTQAGFCVGYSIFISKNIDSLMPDSLQKLHPFHQEVGVVAMIITAAAVLPFCFVKKVKQLGIFSLVADVTLIIGMVIVLSYDRMDKVWDFKGFHLAGLPIFFGIVTSSFEGIGLVVPVEQTMTKFRDRYTFLLDLTLCIVTMLLGGFGMLGYLTYGSDTDSVITMNLPGGALTTVVKVCLIIAIVFTYPMQLFPVTEIFDYLLFGRASDGYFNIRGNLIRLAWVAFTATIGFFVPFFGLISGLIGALGSSTLSFILPVIFHLIMFRKTSSWLVIIKNIVILIFGGAALGVGTVYAIKDIVNAL